MTAQTNEPLSLRRARKRLRTLGRSMHPRAVLLSIARIVLARPVMQPLTKLLFDVSLRGMGILNYRNSRHSGEGNFLKRLGEFMQTDGSRVQPPVVLDVGANVGSYAVLVMAHLPTADVHAFEPHPRTAAELKRRLGKLVKVVAAAAGSNVGTLDLFDYEDADGSVHASPYREVFTEIHKRPPTRHAVPVVRIDDYVEVEDLSHVLLLKIDTEGHELEVLKGASNSLAKGIIECIQFEFNEMNVVSGAFLRDFIRLLPDYCLFRTLPKGLVPLRGSALEEIFAYQNIVAIRNDSRILEPIKEEGRESSRSMRQGT